jgi:hypothetical protein
MNATPISIIFFETDLAGEKAWSEVQAAVGDGLATALLTTPEKRGAYPRPADITSHPKAPVLDPEGLVTTFEDLMMAWRIGIETLMNRRWNLCDNPYAKAWIMPGMILLHEDPLGWRIDAHAEDIRAGQDLEEPATWTILMPKPSSNHATLGIAGGRTLPHADILNAALVEAAQSEGHDDICPLYWDVQTPDPRQLDIIAT